MKVVPAQQLRYTHRADKRPKRAVDTKPLTVDVVMVQVRETSHEWVQHALETVYDQSYPHCNLIEVNNRDRSLSIGAAWNLAVKSSDADFVFPVGDDDGLAVDLVRSLVDMYEHMHASSPNLVHMTSFCTVYDEDTGAQAPMPVVHTGMFLRKFLLDYPFDETLDRGVGVDKQRSIANAQSILGQPMSTGLAHHFGYLFRQHMFMASGNPIRVSNAPHR